jgi:hypothetical protein
MMALRNHGKKKNNNVAPLFTNTTCNKSFRIFLLNKAGTEKQIKGGEVNMILTLMVTGETWLVKRGCDSQPKNSLPFIGQRARTQIVRQEARI